MWQPNHCSGTPSVGINRGTAKEFGDRGAHRFFRPLLYQLSYLGVNARKTALRDETTLLQEPTEVPKPLFVLDHSFALRRTGG